VSIIFGRNVEDKLRLSERQLALADRILGLAAWEIISKEIRDHLLNRLKGDLNNLDVEVTELEKRRAG
jgi:hypothetical protein